MKKITLLFFFLPIINAIFAQNYTSYFTGNVKDTVTQPKGGICLMGGATENDEAMKWFLDRANGGDVLVLRASGSNGYNTYLYSELGIKINSVESIVCTNANAAKEKYLLDKISKAEAIWFAGGDQWKYVSYWRNTAVDSLVNFRIKNKKIAVGGTSAGMAIMGSHYFSAENGSTTSAIALANPFEKTVTIDAKPFLEIKWLKNVVTDTHYDNPDRKGRHIAFLARMAKSGIKQPKGIACDEYTAVCIDNQGLARVFGGFPTYDDNAYFILSNCEVKDNAPEKCENGIPLTWKQNQNALKVCVVKGTNDGKIGFDLKTWDADSKAVWQNWYAENGVAKFQDDKAPICSTISTEEFESKNSDITIFPNPIAQNNTLTIQSKNALISSFNLFDSTGKQLFEQKNELNNTILIDVNNFPNGIYFLKIKMENQKIEVKKFVKM